MSDLPSPCCVSYGEGRKTWNHRGDMKSRSLTPTQRRILRLMRQHGPARFGLAGEYRSFRSAVDDRGLFIGAYASPEYFLKARGIIEPCGDNNPGHFQLTDWGDELARGLKLSRKH